MRGTRVLVSSKELWKIWNRVDNMCKYWITQSMWNLALTVDVPASYDLWKLVPFILLHIETTKRSIQNGFNAYIREWLASLFKTRVRGNEGSVVRLDQYCMHMHTAIAGQMTLPMLIHTNCYIFVCLPLLQEPWIAAYTAAKLYTYVNSTCPHHHVMPNRSSLYSAHVNCPVWTGWH